MDSARKPSVYRYFDLADSFVEIQVTQPQHLVLPQKPGLDKAGYRRLVIATCMPEFRDNVADAIEMLFPDDPLMVEDILYQLCVDVNPGLAIHEVRLEVGSSTPAEAQTEFAGCEQWEVRLRQSVSGLEQRLRKEIIGQDHAVKATARAVSRAAVGLAPAGRPLATLLFAGRTGTGKTELARVLSRELMGPHSLLRIDCSEFALAHEYSKLIGAPPGFVGHEDGGQLTDALRRKPDRVIVFDEIEKAHPKLHNLLLQILEEGALTDGKGRTVSFERCVVILTSNVGAEEAQRKARAMGFERGSSLAGHALEEITHQALQNTFRP
ncbi:MAG: AAA family ATPase [Planctomycetota bacterium]